LLSVCTFIVSLFYTTQYCRFEWISVTVVTKMADPFYLINHYWIISVWWTQILSLCVIVSN
jgi:hypothetical protein